MDFCSLPFGSAEARLALLTPIAKGFLTEAGFEAANLGVQVVGGHGYISEWRMEQIVRDARISMLYEGTNGIQALDPIGRKVLASEGALLEGFIGEVTTFIERTESNAVTTPMFSALRAQLDRWQSLTRDIATRAAGNPDEIGAASFDYLMYSGYTVLAYFWARSAELASQKQASGEGDSAFYQSKIKTAQFYFTRILPRNEGLALSIAAGAETLMAMEAERF